LLHNSGNGNFNVAMLTGQLPTYKLVVSQVTDWSTCRQDNSQTGRFRLVNSLTMNF